MFRKQPGSLALVFILGTAATALAQVPRNPQADRPGPSASTSVKFLDIPGLSPLGMEGVQREIGLTLEQKQQLKAVSESLVASFQRLDSSFRELAPEEQQKQRKEMGDQFSQLARNAQRKAESILSPRQLQAVKNISFQLSAVGALSDPDLQEKLGFSPEQRRRLTAVYEQAGEKMQQLQRDTAAQVMQLLDEGQAAELKRQLDEQPGTR